MREIKIPRVERRDVMMETLPTEGFLEDMAPHKAIHFMSRTGITQVAATLPHNMKLMLEKMGKQNDPKFRQGLIRELQKGTTATSKFVTSLHDAFDNHIPFAISPTVIMSIISQEVARYVKDHSEESGIVELFTRSPGAQEKLVVEVDDFVYGSQANNWLDGIQKFKSLLSERVPSGVLEYMTPRFSEATLETEVSHLVSFMDAASRYYKYGMSTLCGIPEFRIEGTPDDWNTIIYSVTRMSEVLPGLSVYFKNLVPVLVQIRDTADSNKVDTSFWSSIYKVDNESGGPYSTGWFNSLYAHHYTFNHQTKQDLVVLKGEKSGPSKLNQFPSNLSVVGFEWNYFGKMIPMSMVGGITGVEMREGFLTPCLGVAVLELNALGTTTITEQKSRNLSEFEW